MGRKVPGTKASGEERAWDQNQWGGESLGLRLVGRREPGTEASEEERAWDQG